MMIPLLTPEIAAVLPGIKVKTVHELVREGKLACVQVIPRDRKFTEAQLQEFIENRTISIPKQVDRKTADKLPSPARKGGVRSVEDSGADLGKEIRSLCR